MIGLIFANVTRSTWKERTRLPSSVRSIKATNGPLLAVSAIDSDKASPFLFRANVSLIDFDYALELVDHWVLRHGKPNPMEHEPRGSVRNFLAVEVLSHAMELICAHALFAGAHQVDSEEPHMQTDVRVLEDRPHRDREFLPAPSTLVETGPRSLSLQLVGIPNQPAVAADRAIGP
jgi:hypothetical protein